jgi:hypothetical protein
MLRLAYPEIEVLRRAELDKLVAQYSNVPIDEGAAAMGRELSALGWALYRLETGSDDSVFLLVPARQPPPPAMLSGFRYRNASDPDAAEESLDATLLVAIPLAAVSSDRENGTLHYHPDLACWFAHVSSADADDYLEMLRPLPECIAALDGSRTLRRTPGPWIRESRSRTV